MSGLRWALSILAIGLTFTVVGLFEPVGELLLVAGAFGAATALDPGGGREQRQQQSQTSTALMEPRDF